MGIRLKNLFPENSSSMPTIKNIKFVCQYCGKDFFIHDSWKAKKVPPKFCSDKCGKGRKFKINEDYFKEVSPRTLHTFGQILIIGRFRNTEYLILQSTKDFLERISKELDSQYLIKKSINGTWKIEIFSRKIIHDLIELGIVHNFLFQDVPREDILSGMLDTPNLSKDENGNMVFRTEKSKVARWLSEKVSGEVMTKINRIGRWGNKIFMDYFVVWDTSSGGHDYKDGGEIIPP